MLAVFYGLASALVWGGADFAGGLATKKNNVFTVILLSQIAGEMLVFILLPLFGEPFPAWGDVAVGGIAGLCGATGLVFFYRALARGPMGLVSPVTAVVTAGFPVLVTFLAKGLPDWYQLAGVILAIPAVWLVSQGNPEKHAMKRASFTGLLQPAFAGLLFGLFFIFIGTVSERSVLWPLAGARITSLLLMSAVIWHQHTWKPLHTGQLWLIALSGVLDMSGNAFFALAARTGRLDIAAILAGLGLGVTVVLARIFLKEKLYPQQRLGVVLALGVVFLLSL